MAKIKLFCFILSFSMLLFIIKTAPAEENYCRDQESWKERHHLVAKYPNDMDFQTLHALHSGLCAKVERGDITAQQATDIFESARDSILNKKKSTMIKEGKHL